MNDLELAARFMFSGFWPFIAVLVVVCVIFRWLIKMVYAIRGIPETITEKVNIDGTPYVEPKTADEVEDEDDDDVSLKVEW